MRSFFKNLTLSQQAILLLSVVLVIRLISLGLIPLMDTTEARYGEMARIMFETGNWITPMFDYNVPFWGKPPLFTWLSASGITVLGLSEFAVRIPHFLTGTLILAFVWLLAFQQYKETTSLKTQGAWLATAVLASSVTFTVVSGAVMTDTALTLAITISMTAFWLNYKESSRLWGHLFFLGLTIGMLAKGPLALVLIGISLFIWVLFNRNWRSFFSSLPWKTGIPLFLLTSLPWYVIAEYSTPGFLDYFIIGEHIKRFIISGWQGDLYGTAHNQPTGTIWLFALVSGLPWTPLFLYQYYKQFKSNRTEVAHYSINDEETNRLGKYSHGQDENKDQEFSSFLWCWLLSPLLFFTFSGNILSSYVLPALPAFALLIDYYQHHHPLSKKVYYIGFITPILLIITIILLQGPIGNNKTAKNLVQTWSQLNTNNSPLIYISKRPFSAQFYTQGNAQNASDKFETLLSQLSSKQFFVLKNNESDRTKIKLQPRCEIKSEVKKNILVLCK